MSYHIDAEKVSLADLRARIEATDLVPSRSSLKDAFRTTMQALEQQGITTLARLRHELKTATRQAALASATGLDAQYLVLLRREIEGYFPRPSALKTLDWLSAGEIARLAQHGVDNTAALYEATSSAEKRAELAESTGVDPTTLGDLARLADLTRVQWVSPIAARMLIAAGYASPAMLADADADALWASLERVNAGGAFFKGNIGLRDVKRLIHAAHHV